MIRVADLFAGAGGASTGLQLAAKAIGQSLDLVAVNHWPAAVQTHAANHPEARHLCEAIERVDPRDAVPGGKLDVLVAGPECVFFSTARGGKPVNDQRRSSAWSILRWLELLKVDRLLVENVPEFLAWGPLYESGPKKNTPIKAKRGQIFAAFVGAIEAMGYRVEWRILNAADFGEATTRRRMFLQASRGRRSIAWPEPSHSRRGASTLLRHTTTWRAAREVIDWSLPSESIFTRKRPLSPNTLRRIEAGLRRFGGASFVLGQQSGSEPRPTTEPLPTVAASGAISCVEPFLVTAGGPTGQGRRAKGVGDPLPTLLAESRLGLVEPFIIPIDHTGFGARASGVEEPLSTVTSKARHALVEPFVVQVTHGGREHDVCAPLPTITGGQRGDMALVEPFLSSYYGHGSNVPVSQPVPTVTARDRFALVIPEGMDIRFRMLQPHELAAAMGFPEGYQFLGTKSDAIRMIGNAWSVRTAEALCRTILEQITPARRDAGRRERVA